MNRSTSNPGHSWAMYNDETRRKIIEEQHYQKGKAVVRIAKNMGLRSGSTISDWMKERGMEPMDATKRAKVHNKWLRQHARDILDPCPIQQMERDANEILMDNLHGEAR